MAYANAAEVECGFRTLSEDEKEKAGSLLEEASVIIDAYDQDSDATVKKAVAFRGG